MLPGRRKNMNVTSKRRKSDFRQDPNVERNRTFKSVYIPQ